MVCVDTDVIIDFLRNESRAVKKIKELKDSEVEICTTTINSFELFKGAFRSKRNNSIELVSSFLNNLKILSFDLKASEEAAKIFESLRAKGKIIDPLDLMIASVAVTNDKPLLTRNIKHFERISNLKIDNV